MSSSDPIRADFRNFLFIVWKHLKLPDPTPVQYDIGDYLQRGPRRLMVQAFRGVGKSWITSAFAAWSLLCDPQVKILVVSASKQRADDWTTFTMRLIQEIPVLQHLQPKDTQRNSKISFDVGPARNAHAPSVKSVGITGQISGSRADIIIPDDLEIPNNSATQVMRDKLSESIKEFDAVLTPEGRIIYLGTPQTEQSVYRLLPERGYEVRIWPARFPTEKQREAYGANLAPFLAEQIDTNPNLAGRPTDPQRFTDLDLVAREMSYGRSGFALQFMLDTRLSDADRYPLKLSDLMVMSLDPTTAPAKLAWGSSTELVLNDLPNVGFSGDRYHRPAWIAKDAHGAPDFAPYTGSVMYVDPSGRGKDECGYAVVKILNGLLYCTAAGGFLNGYAPETLESLARIALQQKAGLILCEPNFGDGMFTQLLTPVVAQVVEEARKKDPTVQPIGVEESERSINQKEKRIIDTLEPVMNGHRLVIAEHVIKEDFQTSQAYSVEDGLRYSLAYQMTRITRDKGALVRDDRVEALAGAVNYWVEAMARDVDKAHHEHTQAALDKALERFMEHATGRKTTPQGWVTSRWR